MMSNVRGMLPAVACVIVAGCISLSRNASTVQVAPPLYSRSDTTERFAPGVISTGDVFASAFSGDGRTVWFTRANTDRTAMQILESSWTGSGWSAPKPAWFSTGPRQMDPHVSPDGKRLYFTAPRRRDAAIADADGDWDTWSVKLDASGAPATRVTSLANSPDHEMYPSTTIDESLFFGWRARDAGASGNSEIRYTTPKLRTTPATVVLPKELANPSNPYISPNGRVLIFAATATAKARADLYLTVRGGDGRWDTPRSLGREVNSDDTEFCPALTPDGRYLFFSRQHFGSDNRLTGSDIYVVPVASVPVLRDALR